MKKESNSYLALKAMRRASKQALERAARKDLKIPIWKDGKIVYESAKDMINLNPFHSKNA
jgi:hypothetical protein